MIHTENGPADASPHAERLAFVVGFREALAAVADEVRRQGLGWRGLPRLAPRHEAVERRFQEWGTGGGRVSLPAAVKRRVKADLSGYSPRQGRGLWFEKVLTDACKVHFVINNDAVGGVGKGFTVELGVEVDSWRGQAGLIGRENLFWIFEADAQQPCWTYATADDRDQALEGAVGLLGAVLPEFEAACRRFLDPLPQGCPDSIPRQGAITAREGFDGARRRAGTWSGDAHCTLVTATHLSLDLRDTVGPVLGTDGRLASHGAWYYVFQSRVRAENLVVTVPALGTPHASEAQRYRPQPPLEEAWIDSDRALEIAEVNDGREARARGRVFDILARLRHEPAEAASAFVWVVDYLIQTEPSGRADFRIVIDARTGFPIVHQR